MLNDRCERVRTSTRLSQSPANRRDETSQIEEFDFALFRILSMQRFRYYKNDPRTMHFVQLFRRNTFLKRKNVFLSN